MQPTFTKKEQKEIGQVVFLLQQKQAAKDLPTKAAIGVKLSKVSPRIRAEGDRRFQAGAGGSPATRRTAQDAEERTFLKIKAGVQPTPNKPSSVTTADPTLPADPDAPAVEYFITVLEDSLSACAEEKDAGQALREAAQVRVEINDSCRDNTKAALQGLLDSIAGTVNRVFQEGATLVVPRSAEEIQARQEFDDVERLHEQYGKKIRSHEKGAKDSKTVFGSAFERSRAKRYQEKKADLPKFDDSLIRKTEAPGKARKKQRDDVIVMMLDDLRKKAKSAFAVVGGKERLHLREGIDGGVETMNIMIQGYADKLNDEAESGLTVITPNITRRGERAEEDQEEEDEALDSSESGPSVVNAGPATTTTTTTTGVPPRSAQAWRPGVKPQRAPADLDDGSDQEEEEEEEIDVEASESEPRTNLNAGPSTTTTTSVPPRSAQAWRPGVKPQRAPADLDDGSDQEEEEEEIDVENASESEPRTNLNAGPSTTTTTSVPTNPAPRTDPTRPGIRRQPARTNLTAGMTTAPAPSASNQGSGWEISEQEEEEELL